MQSAMVKCCEKISSGFTLYAFTVNVWMDFNREMFFLPFSPIIALENIISNQKSYIILLNLNNSKKSWQIESSEIQDVMLFFD